MSDKTEIVRVRLPNGAVAHVEATVFGDPVAAAIAPVGEEEERRIALTEHSFDGVLKTVEGMAGAVWSVLKKVSPDKASAEFGFEVGIENGQLTGLFVKGSGKGNLKLTLEWGGGSISDPTDGDAA